ncbi:hypothetical protein T492DRAFT_874234 [Pavlovales sp. CCMP2436]|nr:hypothetical protein T492DRAFT_874234 [Pavlovales sp. CCMP2436]
MAAMMLLHTSASISGARMMASPLAGAAGLAVRRLSTAMVTPPSNSPASVKDEIARLQRPSDGGSEIAACMLEARVTWMEGELARKAGECRQGTRLLAHAQFGEAFDAVSDAIRAAPENAYNYQLLALVEGHLPHRSSEFMKASAAVVQDLESFVERTPLGSHKCSEALYEIAVIAFTILLSYDQTGAAKARIVSDVVAACERARAADVRQLEVFADETDSEAKRVVETKGDILIDTRAAIKCRLTLCFPRAQRPTTTAAPAARVLAPLDSNQQIISLYALARAHYRKSIGTRGGAQAIAAD